ncbi:MAG: hypothetical protein Q4G07_07605, partial [Oscillospiraceae bacterium]|nr:hypothetical protein [Oscillospiraceae bacterium]
QAVVVGSIPIARSKKRRNFVIRQNSFFFWVPCRGAALPPDLISSEDGRNEFALLKFSAAFGGSEFTAHSCRPAVRGLFFSISFLPSSGNS